jgi:hypothetical protein
MLSFLVAVVHMALPGDLEFTRFQALCERAEETIVQCSQSHRAKREAMDSLMSMLARVLHDNSLVCLGDHQLPLDVNFIALPESAIDLTRALTRWSDLLFRYDQLLQQCEKSFGYVAFKKHQVRTKLNPMIMAIAKVDLEAISMCEVKITLLAFVIL